jgi:hypothetical protein
MPTATATAIRIDALPFAGPDAPAWIRPRYPRLMDYLAGLPAGIHSYPECQSRSGILQTFLEAAPRMNEEPDAFVAELLRPATRGWVSEVALNAALLAIADATWMTDAQFLEWNRATNRALYKGLVYRALMAIFSPAQLLDRAGARWESFHRGTRLMVMNEKATATSAPGELTFPPRLFTPLLLGVYGEAFAAGFEHARGRDVTVELEAWSDTSGRFRARWR